MRPRILVRILIVLLAAFLIFRIHQRVETYRIPRNSCREQMMVLASASIQHIYQNEGLPAPSLDSLLTFAENNGYFQASISDDSITVTYDNGNVRQVEIPAKWKVLWSEDALRAMESELAVAQDEHASVQSTINIHEASLGFSLDSLVTLREDYLVNNPLDEDDAEDEDILTPGQYFDDSLGFSAEELLTMESQLAAANDSITGMIQNFNNIIAPARRDSVAALVAAICPSLWEQGFVDSVYSYDSKLALGTQFSLSCPNHERHGGIVGGLFEKEFPDSLFLEADWAETQTVYSFPQYADMRRLQVSRANLIRAAEEQAAYLAQRYPSVIIPKQPENLDIRIDELIDPLGGEYVFELAPDTTYVFYENPRGTTRRSRGDSIFVETLKFVGYTTFDPEVSRVEVFFSHPLQFPSRQDGAISGSNDMVTIIMYWKLSELGSLRIEEREVDLLEVSTWDFVSSMFGESHNGDTE